MSNSISDSANKLPYFNLHPRISDDAFIHTCAFLDSQSIGALSTVKKHTYITLYKNAIAQMKRVRNLWINEKIEVRILTYYDRESPYISIAEYLNGLGPTLAIRGVRLTNALSVENPAIQSQLQTLRKGLDYQHVTLAIPDSSTWILNYFNGYDGLNGMVFLQNIRKLIQRYQRMPDRHIFKTLEFAQHIFPTSNTLPTLLSQSKEAGTSVIDMPQFKAFESTVNQLLRIQNIPLHAKDVLDRSLALSDVSFDLRLWLMGTKNYQFLKACTGDDYDQLGLSVDEIQSIDTTLTQMIDYHNQYEESISNGTRRIFLDGLNEAAFRAQFNVLLGILKKITTNNPEPLKQQSQYFAILWQAIASGGDREVLKAIINSHAFFYFDWHKVLKDVLDKNVKLFFYLISFPQVLNSLPPQELDSTIHDVISKTKHHLDKFKPADFLPLLHHPSVADKWISANTFQEFSRYFLPCLLGQSKVSLLEWVNLLEMNADTARSSNLFGVTLHSLVREGHTGLTELFLSREAAFYEGIPDKSSSSVYIPFLATYPFLWSKICARPEESVQLLAHIIRELGALNLLSKLGPESLAEFVQFLLNTPDSIEYIASLDLRMVCHLLPSTNVERLLTMKSQEDLKQALAKGKPLRKYSESLIGDLAKLLFMHDNYFLKFLVLLHKKNSKNFGFKVALTLVQENASLFISIAQAPMKDEETTQLPQRFLIVLEAMEALESRFSPKSTTTGWDAIIQSAAGNPEMLAVLAKNPVAASHMPENLTKQCVPSTSHLYTALNAPQAGKSWTVAQRIAELIQATPALLWRSLQLIKEKCSAWRETKLIFKISQYLSSEHYPNFFKALPWYYSCISAVGRLWVLFKKPPSIVV